MHTLKATWEIEAKFFLYLFYLSTWRENGSEARSFGSAEGKGAFLT